MMKTEYLASDGESGGTISAADPMSELLAALVLEEITECAPETAPALPEAAAAESVFDAPVASPEWIDEALPTSMALVAFVPEPEPGPSEPEPEPEPGPSEPEPPGPGPSEPEPPLPGPSEPEPGNAREAISATPEISDVAVVEEPAAPEPRVAGELDRLMAGIEAQVAQTGGDGSSEPRAEREPDPDVCIVFSLAQSNFAIPIQHVLEIEVVPAVTPVPFVPDCVRGVTNRRGEIMAVIDLRRLLGLEPAERPDSGRIVVVRSGAQQKVAALIVDQVRGTFNLNLERLQRPEASWNDGIGRVLLSVGRYEEAILMLLDVEKVFETPELGSFEL